MTKSTKNIYYKQNRLQQLRGFCHVVQTGSISKAADRMYLSQPSVSLQVQALERELSVVLFERHGPQLKLTPEGRCLYELARPLVDGMDSLYEQFSDQQANVNTGSFKLVVSPLTEICLANDFISHFLKKYPKVKIEVTCAQQSEALELLQSDNADLMLYEQRHFDESISYLPLMGYDMVLVAAKGHAVLKDKVVGIQVLCQHDLIFPRNYDELMPVLYAALENELFSYSVVMQVQDLKAVKYHVAQGRGISVMPSFCLNNDEDLAVVKLDHYFKKRTLGLGYRRGRFLTAQTKNFIKLVQSTDKLENIAK